ncbi:PKD domain protein [Frankia sp. EI5c]|uniref:PKD domain-containing protein n=1 Tax=Frankia sp. EI5c TaxID=683316 RepID=UPI0007C2923C|nr:PKD domain-containing protein [Frankia sp. EI5c]OAA18394.1 PKD domain protein [Frankia sp. EI5c]
MTAKVGGTRAMRHPNRFGPDGSRLGRFRPSGFRRSGLRPVYALRGVVALALLAGGLVLVTRSDGLSVRQLAVEDGAAWLVSSSTGQAALVDGASSQVVTRVAVGSGELSATQSGPDAYVVNSTAGSVLRVDGATFQPGEPVRFGSARRQLRVYPTAAAAFVVDGESGLVTTTDPDTLQARGLQTVATGTAGGAVTDSAGRLWLFDPGSGDIVRLDARGGKASTPAAAAGGSQLVLVGGRPAVVDRAGRTVRPLGENGAPAAGTCLDAPPSDSSVVVVGGVARPEVYAASGRSGTLVISDLTAGSCDTVVDLAAAGHELGQPREAAGRVFIPDFTAGQVIVLDVAARRVVARPQVLPAGTRFELVAQGPFIFFNDPSSFRAGAIHLDGAIRVIEKYNPDRPGAGVTTGPAGHGDSGAGDGDTGDTGTGPDAAPVPAAQPSPQITRAKTTQDTPPVTNPEVTIQVSAVRVGIGRSVTLRLAARDGTRVAGATWSFGDGTTGSGGQTSHAWSQPGDYLVVAHAVLADGRQAAPAVRITVDRAAAPSPGDGTGPPATDAPAPVPDDLLIARLAVTPASGETPLRVTADASTSTAAAAPITGYSFDFGDGTTTGGPGAAASVTHVYESAAPGSTFTVSVTVTDEAGNTSRASQPVTIVGDGAPGVPTMTVTAADGRWRVTAKAGTGGAPTTRFELAATEKSVEVKAVSATSFDVIPHGSCEPFTVTLTAHAASGTTTPSAPYTLDPRADQPCDFPAPVLRVENVDGFGFDVAVDHPVSDGSVTYDWSYPAEGGAGGYSVQPAADRIHFSTQDCRLFSVTVTATGPAGKAVSDPVTGMGCTAPDPVDITRSVVATQITWSWTLPSNTHVESYRVLRTGPDGQVTDGGSTSDPGTSFSVTGQPGETYGITIQATNAAGTSSAEDHATVDSPGPDPGPSTDGPPGDDPTTPPPPPETTPPPPPEPEPEPPPAGASE